VAAAVAGGQGGQARGQRGRGAPGAAGGSIATSGEGFGAEPPSQLALAAARLLLGVALACGQSGGAPQRGCAAAVAWSRGALISCAAAGALPPAAAARGAAACAAMRGVPLAAEERRAWLAVWRACLEGLRANQWQMSDQSFGLLCDALVASARDPGSSSSSGSSSGSSTGSSGGGGSRQQGDSAGAEPWPLPDGWLAAFEAATLARLPTLQPWALLRLLAALAARRHAAGERWLGALLLVLQPWGGRLGAKQLAGLAADLAEVVVAHQDASINSGRGGGAPGGAPRLPSVCLSALAEQAAARAAAAAAAAGAAGGRGLAFAADACEVGELLEAAAALRGLLQGQGGRRAAPMR
jgi:hypothetical protein